MAVHHQNYCNNNLYGGNCYRTTLVGISSLTGKSKLSINYGTTLQEWMLTLALYDTADWTVFLVTFCGHSLTTQR